MEVTWRTYAAISLLWFCPVLTPTAVAACDMVDADVPFESLYERTENVFIGKITAITNNQMVFAVEKTLKGDVGGDRYTIGYQYNSCKMDFVVGQTWLFLGTTIGTGSRLLIGEDGHIWEDDVRFVKGQFGYDVVMP